MKTYLAVSGSLFPLISLLLFVGIFGLVIYYICSDRRSDHRHRMRAMALDDSSPSEGPHRG